MAKNKKQKSLLEKAADVVDRVVHPEDHLDDESGEGVQEEESAEVESSEDLADQSDVKEEPIVIHTTGETVLGEVGDESFDESADQDHSKFDKFK